MNVQNISFGSDSLALQVAKSQNNNGANIQNTVDINNNVDKFENNQDVVKEEKKEKKSLFEKIANFVGSIKKAGVNTVEYTKGGVKGVASFVKDSVATVGVIFVADKVRQGSKIAKEADTSAVTESVKGIVKGISKNFTKEGIKATLKSAKGKGAIAAGLLVGVLGFARQLYKAKLNSNEKNAMIDHKYVKTPVISK